MGAKSYRVQLYPSRAVHLLLKELAEETGQTLSRAALSLIENSLQSDAVINELRYMRRDQERAYENLVNMLAIAVATNDYMLRHSSRDIDISSAKHDISEKINALKSHFLLGGGDAGN